jgi:hypothetical protein
MKAGSTILTPSQKNTAWNGIMLHLQWRRPEPYPQVEKLWEQIFWDAKECVLVNIMLRKETVNAVHYFQMIQKLCCALCDKRPMKRHVILQQDNACPHTAHLTLEKSEKFSWEVFPHPPYSPDLPLLTTTG